MSAHTGWIGVDLDGTLAHYEYGDKDWSPTKIGAPVPAMVTRVQKWLAAGYDVRIFTARVSVPDRDEPDPYDQTTVRGAIMSWCIEHIGRSLPVTCTKDYQMIELWDDRCVQVRCNTGEMIGESTRGLA